MTTIARNKGFSLLEILVAFSVMAISLGILLNIFSTGVHTAVIAEEYTVATQIAESLMARTGVETPLVVGETSGSEAEKYHWRVSIAEIPGLQQAESSAAALMEVNVIVQWDDQAARRVELHSVKTGTAL
ncbi:type II secretion system protein [Methylomarinum sp. Ch1-1]|uniref:Type II secretion system protein n=1 Tax=Methylomarinum roseum TaxID=3067653 RepID=A0AAU7NWR9_9GAMM|nr:type II secretion system protein [Methylomarinum sp. Ch1-1]MDP4522959.1 type II secretion system protein [Methylomarinum sp. Ch1-1]